MITRQFSAFVLASVMTTTAACSLETDEDGSTEAVADQAGALVAPIEGINLPPKQGTSNSGAFSNRPLANTYTQREVQDTVRSHKRGIRIAINPQTVSDRTQWTNTKNMANWALSSGGVVVFCMFDSSDPPGSSHGDGRLDAPNQARSMWAAVGRVYDRNRNVFFEAFNEPSGYANAEYYVEQMMWITQDLPQSRVIIDGMGYAADVQSIKDLWPGLLAYHVYPHWLPPGVPHTQSNYSNLVQRALAGVAHRTFVTEFGANLTFPVDYDDSGERNVNVQFLKGLDDALDVMRPRGTFIYHGWNNGDSYSYWRATRSAKAKVDRTQAY